MSRACPKCGKSFPDEVFFCGYDGTITIEQQESSDFDPRLGKQLGEYILVARIEDGAMGRVYEARHAQTKARVAIKVLHEEILSDSVAVDRFRREYDTANSMDHPNIVDVLDFGETEDGSYFMTMEYLDGEELRVLLDRRRTLPAARMLRIVAQTALALQHAHSFGVIHRDLKPDNIYLCKSEEGDVVRLLDFGSVKLQMDLGPKLTAFGTTLGSPYYMSPEQARGQQDLDQRTDVFALAAIAYEMVTGEIAFRGENLAEILVKVMEQEPAPASSLRSDVPVAIDAVLARGMDKDKERRFSNVEGFIQVLIQNYGLKYSVRELAELPQAQIEEALTHPRAQRKRKLSASSEQRWSLAPAEIAARVSEYALPVRSGPKALFWWAGVLLLAGAVGWVAFKLN